VARAISWLYSAYPVERGKWRVGQALSPWLVTRLNTGPWIRVSGVSEFEWRALRGGKVGEAKTTAAFCALIKPGSIVVDVGANVGFYTLTAAQEAGATGRVIAFEPNEHAANRLRENIALNGLINVDVVSAALGAQEGKLTFHLAPDSEGSSLYAVESQDGPTTEVIVATLDRYLGSAGVTRVDLLKIDAEGAELDVLRGGVSLLTGEGAPVIIIEANPVTLRAAGHSPADLRALIEGYGYTISVIEQMRWQGEPVENWLARRQ
jgi:FkbM family methyltransferase